MTEEEFKQRTKSVGLRAIRVVEALPKSLTAETLGRQLIRSGTSVGANYRAACRARSTADMLSKLAIVEEEADESVFWLEMMAESKLLTYSRLAELIREFNEIVAMTVASQRTLRRNQTSTRNLKSKIETPKSKLR